MQTHFAPELLADPDMREAEGILRACVHCGFCTATCPTYVVLGDERDSPRGRIYLIKDMLEGDGKADATVAKHIDRCLSCLACTTTCPSGVDYQHLVDQARVRIEETYRRPLPERLLRWALPRLMASSRAFGLALSAGRLARPFAGFLPARLAAMLAMVPDPASTLIPSPSRISPEGKRRMRVALLPGCVQPVLVPEIDSAAARLLARCGAEVVAAEGAGCCGALAYHLGQENEARRRGRANLAVWRRLDESGPLDAIVATASGCGSMVKDYGHVFRSEPEAEAAESIAARARDVSEIVADLGLPPAGKAPPLRIAYHSACSLQHGQKIDALPKRLLAEAGFEVVTPVENHLCCGAAGTYAILEPELSGKLRDRKAANLARTAPDAIASGNIGCLLQIGRATDIPIVHTVELLDWATGGPVPAALADIARAAGIERIVPAA